MYWTDRREQNRTEYSKVEEAQDTISPMLIVSICQYVYNQIMKNETGEKKEKETGFKT